jgi:hypothetical protein
LFIRIQQSLEFGTKRYVVSAQLIQTGCALAGSDVYNPVE